MAHSPWKLSNSIIQRSNSGSVCGSVSASASANGSASPSSSVAGLELEFAEFPTFIQRLFYLNLKTQGSRIWNRERFYKAWVMTKLESWQSLSPWWHVCSHSASFRFFLRSYLSIVLSFSIMSCIFVILIGFANYFRLRNISYFRVHFFMHCFYCLVKLLLPLVL